ncbi:unnamed protein product [marine sediment metagenome]|uniref:Uncharacterized protein n=1 Tax=marine sediment metagenome TaxID=412755 RepID=X1J090_9ZZZZ
MMGLQKLIEYWEAKKRNRTAGTMSSPDPWVQWTITYLEELRKLKGE